LFGLVVGVAEVVLNVSANARLLVVCPATSEIANAIEKKLSIIPLVASWRMATIHSFVTSLTGLPLLHWLLQRSRCCQSRQH